MKLAEALTQKKDLKGKIAKLQSQIVGKTTVTKMTDDQEIPDHNALIAEMIDASNKLAELKSRVVATNVKHGLMVKIHQLEEAKFLVNSLEVLSQTEQKAVEFHGGGFGNAQEKLEVLATFTVEDVKEKLAAQQKRLRELDLALQRQNWEVDLVNS